MSQFCGNLAEHGPHLAQELNGQRCIGNLPRPAREAVLKPGSMTLTELVEQWRRNPDELCAEYCADELDDYIRVHYGEAIV